MMRSMVMCTVLAILIISPQRNALAFSPREYPSFMLNVFGYDAVIFYERSVGKGGLSTTIGVDQRYEVRVEPARAAQIQQRVDKANGIELVYNLESSGSRGVDLLARIPTPRSLSVGVFIYLDRKPFTGEIGNPKVLSAIEQQSVAPDNSDVDPHGYQLIPEPTPIYVMRRDRYSRPDGRPLFFLRTPISTRDRIYTLKGAYLVGPHVRVLYGFRTDQIAQEHWVAVDKAVHEFVSTILIKR